MSTSPAKSPLAAEGDAAAGVADWARAGIGSASIRTISTMTGIRFMGNLLLRLSVQLVLGLVSPVAIAQVIGHRRRPREPLRTGSNRR